MAKASLIKGGVRGDALAFPALAIHTLSYLTAMESVNKERSQSETVLPEQYVKENLFGGKHGK